MSGVTIKAQNKERVFAKLKRAAPKIKEALETANMQSAQEIAGMMRRLVPVDQGDLRDSIEITGPGETTPPYSQPGGAEKVPEGAVMITAGNTRVRYPHLVEYGTQKAPAQPFFWPSVRANKKRAKSRATRAMGKEIKKLKG